MSPSAKKRPKNSVVFKMQDEKLQDHTQQPVHTPTEWNQLKMVLKNLSFLRLFKSSNPRIQELYNLAKRYWNMSLKVQKILLTSRDSAVCYRVDQNNEGLQEARSSKKKSESKKLESIKKPKESKAKRGWRERKNVRQICAAVPKREQVEPEVPKTSRGRCLTTSSGAWGRRDIFLKTQGGDTEQLEAADQWSWFEGLPTRIHLPGPRVMCRPSALRLVKRCCTRFCSASL